MPQQNLNEPTSNLDQLRAIKQRLEANQNDTSYSFTISNLKAICKSSTERPIQGSKAQICIRIYH